MIRALAIGPVLALASVASGQWEFELSNPELSPSNPSTTVTLSLAPPAGDWGIAGVLWDVHAGSGGWSDQEMLIETPGQVPGEIAGSSVLDIIAGQLICFGCWQYPGRLDTWRATLTVTDFTPREVELRTETSRFQVYITDPRSGGRVEIGERVAVEGFASVRVIPAPGAAALLGLIAAGVARRRRYSGRTP